MTERNPFDSSGGNLSGFAHDVVPITPDDGTDLAMVAVAITCKGGAGDVVITTVEGNDRTYPIALEEKLPVGITRIKATGTTATGIWAFFP